MLSTMCTHLSLVNRIKTETGTSILIPSNTEKSNIIRIEGSPKGVALAKAEILQMVKKLVSPPPGLSVLILYVQLTFPVIQQVMLF